MTTRPRVRLLGGFTFFDADGTALRFEARKAEQLVAYLVMQQGSPLSREHLAAMFWPDLPIARARANLRQNLLMARRVMGSAWSGAFKTDARQIDMDPTALDVDALEAMTLANSDDPRQLRQLRDQFAGRFMAGASSDSPLIAAWLDTTQARFDQAMVDALTKLLDRSLRAEDWVEVKASAHALLRWEPLSEPAGRALATAHAALGERGRALETLDRLVERLRRNLEIEPDAATMDLRRRLLAVESRTSRAQPNAPEVEDPLTELRAVVIVTIRADVASVPRLETYLRAETEALVDRLGTNLMIVFGLRQASGDEACRAARLATSIMEDFAATFDLGIGIAGARVPNVREAPPRPPGLKECAPAIALAAKAGAGEILIDPPLRHVIDIAEAPFRTNFVGRRFELALLRQALDAARQNKASCCISLVGEAGIGKSRLARELFAIAAEHGWRVLAMPAPSRLPDGVASLASRIGAGLKPFIADDIEFDPAERAILAGIDRHPPQARNEAALLDVEPDLLDELYLDLVRKLVRKLAAPRPLLLHLEDFHAGGVEAHRFAAGLIGAQNGSPLVLIVTSRTEMMLETSRHSVTLKLAPLAEADAEQLARQFDRSPEYRENCLDRAAGNPFFLEQLLLHETRSDDAADREGACPPTIQAVVQSRIDQLSTSARHAIRVAAVAGSNTTRRMIAAIAPCDATPIDGLIERRLLRDDGRQLAFGHDLIRAGVYASIQPSERRRLHRAVGNWLKSLDPAARARHLAQADDPAAPEAFAEAAAGEIKALRFDLATGLARDGLALTRDPALRFRLTMMLGVGLREMGKAEDALEIFEHAKFAALDRADRGRALLGLATVCRHLDRVDQGLASLHEADPLLSEAGANREWAETFLVRGRLLFARGDLPNTHNAYTQCLSMAQTNREPDLEAEALGGLADADYARGRFHSARRHAEASLAQCERLGLERTRVATLSLQVHLLIYTGPLDVALDAARDARDAAAAVHHWRAEINALLGIASASFSMRDLQACRAAVEEASLIIERFRAQRFAVVAKLYRARLEWLAGDVSRAIALVEAALEVAQRTGLAVYGAQVFALLALFVSERARKEWAIRQGEAVLARGSVAHNELRFRLIAALVYLTLNEGQRARHHLDALESFMAAEPPCWAKSHISVIRCFPGCREDGVGDNWEALEAAVTKLRLNGLKQACRDLNRGNPVAVDALVPWALA